MTAAHQSSSPDAGLSIGAVLARLRGEFPDLSISKIRYLESEELVTPARTPAGYRQFHPPDVERLRFVLAAQRDHYLPLKVIKEQLDAIDRGLAPSVAMPKPPRPLVVAADPDGMDFTGPPQLRMTRAEILVEADLTDEQLTEIESLGLVAPEASGYYGEDAALAARTVGELIASGLETRHLRPFRAAAQRHAELATGLVAAQARQRDPDARQRAGEQAAVHAAALMRLHALVVKQTLRADLGV